MNNNLAFVATLKNVTPIVGATKIIKADVVLNDAIITSVVAGVDTQENTPVVYFDSNMCLSETLLKDYPDLGKYLGKGGRVKVVKLKGTISNGLVVPVEHFFKYEKKSLFIEGFSFDKLGGKEMCHKYIVPIKVQSIPGKKGRKGKRLSRMLPDQFHFHIDTDQLARNIHNIKPDDVISISSKYHGTSFVSSKCLVLKKLSILGRILYRLYLWSQHD